MMKALSNFPLSTFPLLLIGKHSKELKRLYKALANSCAGFSSAWKHEAAFRQEIIIGILLIPLIFLSDTSAIERALMWMTLLLVPLVELINSAIEATVDRIGLEHHPLSGRAKDVASAAVLLSLLLMTSVWLCILIG
ncbi:diacylglycerol kinase [Halomonas shantousis]